MMTFLTFRICALIVTILGTAMASEEAEDSTNLINRDELLTVIAADAPLCAAVKRTETTLREFCEAWELRTPSSDQFIVVVGNTSLSMIEPMGVLVDKIDAGRFWGTQINNQLPIRGTGRVSCSFDKVIDWRYRNALELVGGEVYQLLFRRLTEKKRRELEQEIPFYIRRSTSTSTHLSIASGDIIAFEKLLQQDSKTIESLFEVPTRSVEGSDWIGRVKVNIVEYGLMYGDARIVEMAIKYEKHFGKLTRSPPMYICASEGNIAGVRQLLELEADVNDIDEETGYSPLHIAVLMSDEELTSILLDAGADPNIPTYDGKTPIFYAKTAATINSLVTAGAAINSLDSNGYTVLDRHFQSLEYGLANTIKLLGGKQSATSPTEESFPLPYNQVVDEIILEVGEEASELRSGSSTPVGAVLPLKGFRKLTPRG